MKAILMSIQPKWVAKILNKEKTIEVRKRFPLGYRGWVYIYCTKEDNLIKLQERYKDRYICEKEFKCDDFPKMYSGYEGKGKVVARFYCDNVEEIICRPICGEWESYTKTLGYSEISQASCLGNREIVHYLKGNNGYAIHISQLEIFDDPRYLYSFYKVGSSAYKNEYDTKKFRHIFAINKAPQSWQYVEIEGE